MTIIKAAAVQLSPVLYSREGTVDEVVKAILDLGSNGVCVFGKAAWHVWNREPATRIS